MLNIKKTINIISECLDSKSRSKFKSQNIPSPTLRVEMQRRNVSGNLNILLLNISSKLMERTELEDFLYSSLPPAPVKGIMSKVVCCYTCKPHQFEVMENFSLRLTRITKVFFELWTRFFFLQRMSAPAEDGLKKYLLWTLNSILLFPADVSTSWGRTTKLFTLNFELDSPLSSGCQHQLGTD